MGGFSSHLLPPLHYTAISTIALVVVLLLSTIASAKWASLSSPRRTSGVHPRHMVSPKTRVLFDVIPKCVPAMSNHLLAPAKLQRCPCFVSFGLSSPVLSEAVVDFMVMSKASYAAWGASSFGGDPPSLEARFSSLGASASAYSFVYDFYYFQTENMELDLNETFAFVARTTAAEKDCDVEVMHIFDSKPSPCPERLPALGAEALDAVAEASSSKMFSELQTVSSGSNNVVAGSAVTDEAIVSYMVAIRSAAGSCSGTVIAPQWILTAAHCQVRSGGRAYVAGDTNVNGAMYSVSDFIPHPDYKLSANGTLEGHDIALVRVEGVTRHGTPLLLNSDVGGPSPGVYVRASGYGQIAEEWSTGSDVRELLQVDMPTVAFKECVRAFVRWGAGEFARSLRGRGHICVGFLDGDCGGDTCYGDSGGPIVVREEGSRRFVQVGVVSGGIGCARPGLPGIYTRVGAYFGWINETTGGSVRGVVVHGADESIDIGAGDAVDEAQDEEVARVRDVRRTGLVVTFCAVGAAVVTLTALMVAWVAQRRRKGVDGSVGGTRVEGAANEEEDEGDEHDDDGVAVDGSRPAAGSADSMAAASTDMLLGPRLVGGAGLADGARAEVEDGEDDGEEEDGAGKFHGRSYDPVGR